MPPALAPIIAWTAATLGVSTATAGVLVGLTFSIAISALTTLLTPKPRIPNLGSEMRGRTLNLREPISPRQLIYGRVRVGGVITLIELSSDNQFLHIIVSVAGHEVDGFEDVFFDDTRLTLDSNGDETGDFSGLARIKFGLGTTAGDADFNSELMANIPTKWSSDHKQEGVAKIYARLKFDREKFSKIPNITAIVRGKKVFDPRDSQTKYSNNAALCLRDYLTDSLIGFGEVAADINDTDWQGEANICEESVTLLTQTDTFTVDTTTNEITLGTDPLAISAMSVGNGIQLTTTGTLPSPLATATTYYWIPVRKGVGKLATTLANAFAGTAIDITTTGSGTHTLDRQSELRYQCDGVIVLDKNHRSIFEELLSASSGRLVWQNGKWSFYSGAYRSPTISYNEDDTLEPLSLDVLRSRRDLINSARGVFVDPDNNFQPSDFPAYKNSTYINEDSFDVLWLDAEYPLTISSIAPQRLSKIEIEKSRQQISVNFTTGLKGLRNKTGDTIQLSNSRLGWTNKVFEVYEWVGVEMKKVGDEVFPVVKMKLQETASTLWDWNQGEETKVDPAPNTNLPNPNNISPPTALMLDSGTAHLLIGTDGSVTSRINVTWTAPNDVLVDTYEIEFKKSADAAWTPAKTSFEQTEMFIEGVQDSILYDVRVRAVNVTGAKSAWAQELSHTVLGKSERPSEPDSFSFTEEADGTRRFSWTHGVPEPDVRSGGGYLIRYYLGTTTNWAIMTPIHEFKVTTSPYVSRELAAGTYTFAIKTVDSTGNESLNALFVSSVAIGNPPIANAIIQRNEAVLGWPGQKVDCFVNSENELEATGSAAWSSLPAAWSSLDDEWRGIVTNNSPIVYTTPVIDLGRDFTIKPIVSLVATGSTIARMKTGTDSDGAPTFVSDLVSNGDFATDLTSWTDGDSGTGASTWVSGEMDLNAGGSGTAKRYQTISGLTIGNVYQVKFDIIGTNVGVTIDGDTEGDGAHVARALYAPGTNQTIEFVAAETSATIVFDTTTGQGQVDNVSMGEFVELDLISARYIQIQVQVSGTTPVCHSMITIVDAPSQIETFEDINSDTSTDPNFHKIGTGHFKIRTQGGIDLVTQAQLTIQGSAAGYTYNLVAKNNGFGDNQTLNWDFATDLSNWTDNDSGTGVSSWVSGAMRLNGGSSGEAERYQTISGLTVGQRYQVKFNCALNPCDLTIDGDTLGDGAHMAKTNFATGDHVVHFVAAETSATLVFSNDQNNNSDVDGVILWNGDASAEFKIYNASDVAANAVVDVQLRGARV